jgi:UTP-glucose-1-phosphate uridylyltransferase
LHPDIFDLLETLPPGANGEYQITDALLLLTKNGELVAASISAKRYDTGDKLDYLRANVERFRFKAAVIASQAFLTAERRFEPEML